MKKRALTLIEIMIVILLITLIGGAIGYNVKGSLKKGRDFKTDQAKAQLEDILELCLHQGYKPEDFLKEPIAFLKKSGLVKDPKSLIEDGHGRRFIVTYDETKREFTVTKP